MSSAAFRGAAPPEGGAPRVYTVVGAERHVVLDLTILEERILGVRCHWVIDEVTKKGRCRLCYDFEGRCPYCGKAPERWVGFLGVYNHAERQRQVFRMGPEGARNVARYASSGGGLRGVRLEIRQATNGRLSSLDLRESKGGPLIPCPSAPEIHATVCLVLGCKMVPDYRRGADELLGPVDSDEQGGVS